MSGEQRSNTPESDQHKPAENPPSLSEPSRRRQPIPALPEQISADQAASRAPAIEEASSAVDSTSGGESFYRPDDMPDVTTAGYSEQSQFDDEKVIEWVSSGEELRARAVAWRVRMTFLSLLASGIVYLITRDIFSAGSVGAVGLLFGLLGSRKPPSLSYMLSSRGVQIGRRQYGYNEFRAFMVDDDVQASSINLIPLKRFLPLLSLHCDPKQRDEIVEMLAAHLPMEMYRRDAIDSIVNRVKF